MAFCEELSRREGENYRLPTEAEWEYACRAGTETRYYWGNAWNNFFGWCWNNSGNQSHPVGQKRTNTWGLYDMSGNVWEWCSDWYDEGYYSRSPSADPRGPSSGQYRVIRGGFWDHEPRGLRSSNRLSNTPDDRDEFIGFRILRNVD